ncbi:MAG: dihydroorotate dehydrogenase electron transfer subunit [Nitrospirota bacterium]
MSRFFRAEIVSNLLLNNKNNLLTIKPMEPVTDPDPGQFYMLKVSNSKTPLLSRPFSFFRKTPEGIQFLFEIRGKGTLMMKGFKSGEVIHMLGPLGRGYPELEGDKIPMLVAGGIGIASIFPLVQAFGNKACLFYGARDKEVLLMLDELKGLVGELIISTDDGSMGRKGTVVDVFIDFLTHMSPLTQAKACGYSIYACGPKPMLKAVSKIALERRIRGYISAEENMACGVGACLGCAIKVKSKELRAKSKRTKNINSELRTLDSELMYKMVCKDGPVFPLEEIVW